MFYYLLRQSACSSPSIKELHGYENKRRFDDQKVQKEYLLPLGLSMARERERERTKKRNRFIPTKERKPSKLTTISLSVDAVNSVTRFGKFCHFGDVCISDWAFSRGFLHCNCA